MAGLQPSRVEGRLELEAVGFAYPSRPEVPVFTDFCLTVEPGQTVALVGPSGSGRARLPCTSMFDGISYGSIFFGIATSR